MNKKHDEDIDQLNSFLRGEISAVETYGQAIDKVDDATALSVLRDNRTDHERRAELLRQRVRALGGRPADGSGVWGSFAQAVEGGAKMFGTSAAISALEEGEDHGLADYRRDLTSLSPEARSFVFDHLLPAQQRTHDAMSRLKSTL